MAGDPRCGFCGKVKEEGEPMVQSPLNLSALICPSCVLFFKGELDKQAEREFMESFRPDEPQTT